MKKVILILIILVHSFILTKTIFFPYPELFIYPYLANHGLKPYSEILDQHFPGLMFFPVNFDSLGMTNPDIARVWLITVVIMTQLLLFVVARTIFKDDKTALLVNFLYLLWQPFFEGWVLWIDTFLPIFLLTASYLLLQKKYLLTGFALGLAVIFKQTAIPLSILISIFIIWEKGRLKEALLFLLGFIIPVFLTILYYLFLGVLYDFWYWSIVFNLTIYAKNGTSIPLALGFVTRILLVYITSLTGLFYRYKRVSLIIFLFLIGSLAGIFDRADFVHFQPSLPFAALLTICGFDALKKNRLAIVIVIVYSTIALWWQLIFYQGHLGSKVFFFDENVMKLVSKVELYTNPGDRIFVFGEVPHLYQMTKTLPSGNIFVFQFPWFLKIAEDRVLEGIIKDQPVIIVSKRDNLIEGVQIKDFAGKIDAYINENYMEIDRMGDTAILKKKGI